MPGGTRVLTGPAAGAEYRTLTLRLYAGLKFLHVLLAIIAVGFSAS